MAIDIDAMYWYAEFPVSPPLSWFQISDQRGGEDFDRDRPAATGQRAGDGGQVGDPPALKGPRE